MSSQQPETPKTPLAEPILCKMGCGFFGNTATGGCCSKCWAQIRPKEASKQEEPPQSPKNNEPSELATSSGDVDLSVENAGPASAAEEKPSTLAKVSEHTTETAVNSEVAEEIAVASPAKKKKKKKISYKSMMANMLEGTGTKDVEKEKEKLRDVTGGGHFKKIDRI